VSTIYSWTTGGYGPAATEPVPAVCTLFDALIAPIREMDAREGRDFLRRFLDRPQHWVDATRGKIESLPLTDDPATCPADLLQYLKDIVGLTKELDEITSRLSERNLRRLIALAVPFWKERSTSAGILNAIRLLTGKQAVYHDWFYYRTILGEAIIGEEQVGFDTWIIGGVVTRFDEFTSSLRLMDDGTLDEQLLLDIVELSRMTSERVEVYLVDFLDVFTEGRELWTNVTAPPASVDTTNKTFLLPAGSVEEPLITVVTPSSIVDAVLIQKVTLGASADLLRIRFRHEDASNYYELEVGTTSWVFRRVTAGAPVVLSTFAPPFPLIVGINYKVRIVTTRSGGVNLTRAYLNGSLALSLSEVAASPAFGGFRYAAPGANAASVVLDNVEAFRLPMRSAQVQPSGTTTSSNFFA
jgi:phage tail-like protein